MKSIREWMAENNMGNMGDMSDMQTRGLAMQFRGGVKVNPRVRSILKPALERAIKGLSDENPMDVLKEVLAVAVSVIGDVHGTRVTPQVIQQMVKELENEQPSEE